MSRTMEKQEERSIATATLHLATSTSLHGPSHIVARKSLFGKLLWLAVVLAAFGFLVYQFKTMIQKYYSWPVTTSTTMENHPYLDFPAITICNVNPVRMSKITKLPNALQTLVKKVHERPDNIKKADFGQQKGEMQTKNDFYMMYGLLPDAEKKELGHNINNMMVDCMWGGRQCTEDNFTSFLNWKYGNCFTFNHGANGTIELSRESGPLYGLRLTLYIQEEEYAKQFTNSYGVKVVVHNQTDMPFPEDSGFFLAPGEETSVGLKLTKLSREDQPHGLCKNISQATLKVTNAYINTSKDLQHTHKTCKFTCLQKRIIETCDCSSYRYPDEGLPFEVLKASGKNTKPCNESGAYAKTCMGIVTKNEMKFCSAYGQCPVQCVENLYTTTISMMAWPSDDNLNKNIKELLKLSKEGGDKQLEKAAAKAMSPTTSKADKMDFVKKNMLVVNIFYENFYVQTYITEASYGVFDLFSDVGGTFGLWMGLSVITLIEFVEFFVDLIRLLTTSTIKPKKANTGLPSAAEGGKHNEVELEESIKTNTSV